MLADVALTAAPVADLARQGVVEFLQLAPRARVCTTTTVNPLDRVNEAFDGPAGRPW